MSHTTSLLTLDTKAFYGAFSIRARDMGFTPTTAGAMLGIDPATVSRLKHGTIDDMYAARFLVMCRWAGLNPMDYLIDLTEPVAPRACTSWPG